MEKYWERWMALCMVAVVLLLADRGFMSVGVEVARQEVQAKKTRIVIDAGHGGKDPGKVGENGEIEREINLEVAYLLKEYLEAADLEVVMTRTDENTLYQGPAANQRLADLKERCRWIEESGADLVVSIHQNSYHDPKVHGTQVFYYTHSTEGKALAEEVQRAFHEWGPEQNRQIKANAEYYLLLHVPQPIVIVECGFLSNPEDAKNIQDEAYQRKVAFTIQLGVLRYLNQKH